MAYYYTSETGNAVLGKSTDDARTSRSATKYPRVHRKPHGGPKTDWVLSTKYTDSETGLLYYGYRYYQPESGRWTSHDPIGEIGGVNLYEMINNAPTCKCDVLGLMNEPPSTVYFIGYLTQGIIYEGYCGEWQWIVKWVLSYLADGDGYVIQHIRKKMAAFNCDTPPKQIRCSSWKKSLKTTEDFWEEVGLIRKGEGSTGTTEPGDDVWRDGECDLCTQGTITIEGRASFYDSISPAPPTHPLPWSPGGNRGPNPPNYDGVRRVVGPIVRTATVTWNCCKGREKTSVSVTPTP